jgi:C1A family cysteine protease
MTIVRGLHGLGWKNSLPDFRDYKLPIKLSEPNIPGLQDLSSAIDWLYDQGRENSCTCNCGASLFRFIERKDKQNIIAPSRSFLYYNVRELEGDAKKDSGAEVRTVLKSLANTGVCSEDTWSYSAKNIFTPPSSGAYALAVHNKLNVYMAIEQNHTALRACLAEGYPFIFGFSLYSSFESDEVARTGMMPMPQDNEDLKGGHAVMAVGYDDHNQFYIVMNSWGPGWGDHGYFYMPYAYMENHDLADDFWTARSIIQI